MRTPVLSAPSTAGLLIGLFGAAMFIHRVFPVDAIARLLPGAGSVNLVAPLLFVAVGLCLAAAAPGRWHASASLRPVSLLCLAALLLLPLAHLIEGTAGIDLGVDLVRPGTVATPEAPHPGRMSPNASLAFLLAGLALWLHARRTTRAGRLAYLALVLAVAGLGLAGLAGHFIGLDTLYRTAGAHRMPPATALGLAAVGAGLWTLYESSQASDGKALRKSERRIRQRSIAVITLVALGAGVAGFAVMRDTFEQSVSRDMLLTATTTATSLAHTIEVSLLFPRTIATRPAARQAMDRLSRAPGDTASLDFLQRVAESFLTADITRVEIHAAGGARVARAGAPASADVRVIQRLEAPRQTTTLAWHAGYLLFAETEVVVDGRLVGRVITEQRMPLFDQLLREVWSASDTADVAICGRVQDKAVCAPNRLRPDGFETPMFDAAGQPTLPVNRALLGERGVRFFEDARGVHVVSAFTPIGDFGLALAVKNDVDTLYAPLRSSLGLLALALLGMIALGIYAQHSQVRPVLQQLVASEQQVKAILEGQTELVSLARPDGALTYVNPAYARHFGLEAGGDVGGNLFDHVDPADRGLVRQVLADVARSGRPATSEHRTLAAGGGERWVAWTHSLHHEPSGLALLHSVGRDVTERKYAETVVRSSQALLERMGRVAGVGAWELDVATGALNWNEQTRRIHEVGPDFTPTLDNAIAFYAPESRPLIEAAVRTGIARGEPWRLEVPLVTATGRRIWVCAQGEAEIEDGKPVRLVGAVQDITQRMLADRALRTLTAIFDATTDYVIQNDPQGRLTYLNPAARRRTGLAPDAPIEHLTLADLIPPPTLERLRNEVRPAALADGVWLGESQVWDAERREFPVSHLVIAHRDTQGEIEYFSSLMRDISAAKAAQEALRAGEHRLRMVTDNLPVLIAYLDLELRYRFVNRTYEQWFGVGAAPRLGSTVREFYGDRDADEIEPHLRAALEGREVTYERALVRSEGVRHVHSTVVPDRDAQGRVVGLYALIADVTSFRETRQALQQSEARLRTVADALPIRVAYIDADERYRFGNLAYERAFGRPRGGLEGETVRSVLGEAAYAVVEPYVRRVLAGEAATFHIERDRDGVYACMEIHYIPQRSADGRTVLGYHAVASDITHQKLEEKRLVELARVDPLTGVVNRAGFGLRLADAMQRCRHSGAPMALMYLDIDHFKQINDRLGHDVGDALLCAFAARLTHLLRTSDTVARLGGDEFTVIMEGLPRPDVAAVVADKIVQAMRTPFHVGEQRIDITASIGLAFYQGDATSAEALVKRADVMLYQAKRAGRNNVQVAQPLAEGGREA